MDAVSERHERLTALGHQLIDTHARLLQALDELRAGGEPSRDLRTHCATFCSAVTRHHTGEDTSVFSYLSERHPQLRPVLEGLQHDHEVIAGLLRRVAETAAAVDPAGARAELDGIAAILESHFAWEEKRLVAVLNDVAPDDLRPQW